MLFARHHSKEIDINQPIERSNFLTTIDIVDVDPKNIGINMDIVDTAVQAGSFTTLVAAVQAAGLAETLKGTGPFTVFAPTDEAFAKLPKGTVEALLNDIPKLKQILTYHVVAGKVMAADVVKIKSAKTVEGSEVKIDASSGVKINNSTVTTPDVAADNGVIHIIDTVLMPA